MGEEEALLAAIQADPADEVARLAFADWFEENGDPQYRVVRGLAELARLAPGDAARPAREAALRDAIGRDGNPFRRFPVVVARVEEGSMPPVFRISGRCRANVQYRPRFGFGDYLLIDGRKVTPYRRLEGGGREYRFTLTGPLGIEDFVLRVTASAEAAGRWQYHLAHRSSLEYEA